MTTTSNPSSRISGRRGQIHTQITSDVATGDTVNSYMLPQGGRPAESPRVDTAPTSAEGQAAKRDPDPGPTLIGVQVGLRSVDDGDAARLRWSLLREPLLGGAPRPRRPARRAGPHGQVERRRPPASEASTMIAP